MQIFCIFLIKDMVTVYYGDGNRTGNQMLMYVTAQLFAKKFGYVFEPEPLYGFTLAPDRPQIVTSGFNEPGKPLHTKPNTGTKRFTEPVVSVHDYNLMELLSQDTIPDARYHFLHYFQIKDYVLKYRNEIKNMFEITYNPQPKDQMMVVVRLGDVAHRRQRLPLAYYIEAIELLLKKGCTGGYITSDSMNHPDIIELINRYGLKPYYCDVPIEKINHVKDFDNIVLSEGTFCWWMGMLSNATNVICNDRRDRFTWHGDIFVFPEWVKLNHDCPELPEI